MKAEEKLLLKPEDFKPYFPNWKIEGIFNPGAIRQRDGKIILFVRVAERFISDNFLEYPVAVPGKEFRFKIEKVDSKDFLKQDGNMLLRKDHTYRLSNISHFRKVIMDKNGFDILKIDQEPCFYPTESYEEFGVEDSRIVKIGKKYLMSYVSVSQIGITGSIAISNNLIKWKKLGIIFSHENKDCVLFPEKIKGEYAALTRPVGSFNFENPSVWITYSKDLKEWGKSKELFSPRENSWEEKRIGSGCPPMKTKKGWLLLYHGARDKIYSAGAILLDLKNPEKILARSPKDKPLFFPNKDYEKSGYVNNVIFPTGIVENLDKKSVLIYSGAGDKYICVKKVLIKDILESMEKI
ncbi:MAG: glycosidase [Nanoarchaeota archaeon]|nr:glycosidase [Nanoarchaeota archaeon]